MMGLGRKKEGVLLLGIVLAALALRLTTYRYEYLLGVDPFHHYRIAEYLAEKGELPMIWPLSLAPTGAAVTEPVGLYYISVLLYKFLEPIGFSFLQAFKLASPIFGAVTIVPAYLLARRILGTRAALYASLVLAFLPAFMYRSFSGFYRGDSFSVFFMLPGFYLFLVSLDGTIRKRAAASIFAGISFGLMGLVWNGFLFGFGVLTAAFIVTSLVSCCRGAWSRSCAASYAVSAGLGIALIYYSVHLYPNTAAPIGILARYVYPGSIVLSCTFGAIGLIFRRRGALARAVVAGLLILALPFLLLVLFPGLMQGFTTGGGGLSASYGALNDEGTTMGGISELGGLTLKAQEGIEEVSLDEKYGVYHLLLGSGLPAYPLGIPIGLLPTLAALVGLFDVVNRSRKEYGQGSIFLIVWAVASFYLLFRSEAPRFTFLAAPVIALLWGRGLEIFLGLKTPGRFPDRLTIGKVVVVILLIPVLLNGVVYASERSPDMGTDWQNALEFLKTQESGPVLSWWDAGSWIQGVTGFPTIVDSVHGQRGDRVKAVAEVLLENNTRTGFIKDFLAGHGVRYIVVSIDLIYQLKGIEAAANASGYDYSILYSSGSGTIEGKKAAVYGKERNFIAYRDEGGVQVLYLEGSKAYRLETVHYQEKEGLVTRRNEPPPPILEGGVYATKEFIVYASPRLEGTLLNSLVLLNGEGFSDLKQIYSNPRVRIYAVVPR